MLNHGQEHAPTLQAELISSDIVLLDEIAAIMTRCCEEDDLITAKERPLPLHYPQKGQRALYAPAITSLLQK